MNQKGDIMYSGETLLLVDKPKGISSYQVIRILQRMLPKAPDGRALKMGHAGTLDPAASGLMLIGIGSGTKDLSKLIGLDKTYEAEILLGTKTDSGDLEGKVVHTLPVPQVTEDTVKHVLASLYGTHEFPVPIFSAVKRGGKPLYAYARAGKAIEAPIKAMTVKKAELMSINQHPHKTIVKIFFEVGSGTYIRTLAEVIGERLGTVATLHNLRRLSVGDYSITQAMQIPL
jgi:tRNA pseudouridine55 synthase